MLSKTAASWAPKAYTPKPADSREVLNRSRLSRSLSLELGAPACLIAAGVVALLLSFASGYGYHRDELYFLAAGQHLDWAFPDQGVLTPLIARAMN